MNKYGKNPSRIVVKVQNRRNWGLRFDSWVGRLLFNFPPKNRKCPEALCERIDNFHSQIHDFQVQKGQKQGFWPPPAARLWENPTIWEVGVPEGPRSTIGNMGNSILLIGRPEIAWLTGQSVKSGINQESNAHARNQQEVPMGRIEFFRLPVLENKEVL